MLPSVIGGPGGSRASCGGSDWGTPSRFAHLHFSRPLQEPSLAGFPDQYRIDLPERSRKCAARSASPGLGVHARPFRSLRRPVSAGVGRCGPWSSSGSAARVALSSSAERQCGGRLLLKSICQNCMIRINVASTTKITSATRVPQLSWSIQ